MIHKEKQIKILCFVIFSLVYLILGIGSFQNKSATYDEPIHVTSAYGQVVLNDYRIDPTHPPLLRLWAGAPMLFAADPLTLDQQSDAWKNFEQWTLAAEFLYRSNDADSIITRSRFMMLLLGVFLGALLYVWAIQIGGLSAGLLALGLYLFEPNMHAHARLVTTDFGAVFFAFASVYFCWRVLQYFSLGNAFGFVLSVTGAVLSKYSLLLLLPLFLVFFALRIIIPGTWIGFFSAQAQSWQSKVIHGLSIWLVLVAAMCFGIWASYGWHYYPAANNDTSVVFHTLGEAYAMSPSITALVEKLDELKAFPNAFLQGFLSIMVSSNISRESYLLGESKVGSWASYFPIAFLVKTSATLLLLFGAGLFLLFRRYREVMRFEWICLAVILVFFLSALGSELNIGVRHILVIYPFVILIALRPLHSLWRNGYKPWALLLVLLGAAEYFSAYPHLLSFFNPIVGGPSFGHHILADSNLDWGQDLPALKEWMDKEGVERINLSYFGSAEPSYYDIEANYMPGTRMHGLKKTLMPAQLPGWLALSVTNLVNSAYTNGFYESLKQRKPDVVLNHTIYLYWLEKPWWSEAQE